MESVDRVVESAHSVERFLRHSSEKGLPGERFEAEGERMLRIEVDGGVWLKPGAAVAYRGEISFERLPTIEAETLKDAALRELTPLVRAVGRGRLYCAHHGYHVRILQLSGEPIVVSWQELLAFEESLEFEMDVLSNGLSLAAGGLVVVKLSGCGAMAIATHGEPLTLPVTRDGPVSTDPNSTLAWSGGLSPSLKTDLSWRSVFAHGGQEPFQMFFEGEGFVVVQPHKDARRLKIDFAPLRRIKSMLAAG
jgi:uncharacterized protein (AIM24 family)